MLASLKVKGPTPFSSSEVRFQNKKIDENERFLGPGYYEVKPFTDVTKPHSIENGFTSKEGRFKRGPTDVKLDGKPGPGHYESDDYDHWNKQSFNKLTV